MAYYVVNFIETVDGPKLNNRPLRIELKGLISVTKFEHDEDKTRSLYQNKPDMLWLSAHKKGTYSYCKEVTTRVCKMKSNNNMKNAAITLY